MKKTFNSLLCVILSVLICLSVIGCNQGEVPTAEQEKLGEIGTHIFNVTDTDEYIVQSGSTNYKLVIPEDASKEVLTAKDEFLELFREATGIRITVVTDNNSLVHDANAKYISLGNTSLLISAFEDEYNNRFTKLGYDGVRILTKDKTVYMFGGSDIGTTFSVYTFMEIYFNFDQYYRNCYEIDTGVKNVVLKNFDITDIPDIDFRFSSLGVAKSRWDTIRDYEAQAGLSTGDIANRDRRMRLADGNSGANMMMIYKKIGEGTVGSGGGTIHNTAYYVTSDDVNVDSELRSKWLSNSGNQLCYTTRGDANAYSQLVEHCADKILYSMSLYTPERFPRTHYVPFTQMDSGGFCTCETCAAEQIECGGLIIGSIIKLANDIIDKVYEKQQLPEHSAYARDDLKIVIFAYAQSQYVPATYNEVTDEWETYGEKFTPSENMCVWCCPTKVSFVNDIYEPVNDEPRKNIEGWSAIASEMWFWMYNQYYLMAPYFCDNFNIINTDSMKFFANTNATQIFDEMGNTSCSDATAWSNLKVYLDSKLYWNCNLDSEKLIQKYFKAMFKDAAPEMLDAFTFLRDYTSKFKDDPNALYLNTQINNAEYYPYSTMLKVYIEKLDKAMEVADKGMATDPGAYDLVKARISLEYISPYYAVFDIYGNTGSTSPLSEETKSFYKQNLYNMATEYFPDLWFNDSNVEVTIWDYLDGLN